MGRRLRFAIAGLVVLGLGLLGGVWWWADAPVVEPPPAKRVGQDRRPQWAKRFVAPRLPSEGDVVAVPPSSVAPIDVDDPIETDASLDDEIETGTALLSGWLVDARGADVEGGRVAIICMTYNHAQPDILDREIRRGGRIRDGNWFEAEVEAPANCSVQGFRSDGLLFAQSKPVRVLVEPDEVFETDLIVPAERTGGIGVSIAEHDDGILVNQVHRGTPAHKAGIRDGDIIVHVDGIETVDLDLQAFIARTTGAEGTDVQVRVMSPDGFEQSHVIRRQYLDRSLVR